MPGCARMGDPAGGLVVATAATVRVNGLLVARFGDAVTPHGDSPHDGAVLVGASGTVKAEGIRVSRVGDAASCGDSVSAGSGDVQVGG